MRILEGGPSHSLSFRLTRQLTFSLLDRPRPSSGLVTACKCRCDKVQVLSSGLQIYLTPAVIYFSSVLLMSALLTVPNQTRLAALICICLEGAAGLGYSGSLAIGREAGSAFCEARSDLFPYVLFPFGAYALMVGGGLVLLRRPQIGLDLVAAGMLVLLGVAIRNSWSIAVTIVSPDD